ncbi:MAG: hypothetical protein WC722_16860 [Rhodospirillales bacterium]
MIVAIHADAGPGIGLGHAIRCCGLALALAKHNMIPIILNAAGDGLRPLLNQYGLTDAACQAEGASVVQAARAAGAAMLVVDSYRLDRRALAALAHGLKLVWFDDTAEQPMIADAIINGSPAALSLPYALPAGILGLLGPDYQVVRPGLTARPRRGPVRRLLVTYGGSDPKGVGKVLAGILPAAITTDFVVGPFAETPANLSPQAHIHKAPKDMPALIECADLAISAGGQTLFELAAAQVPTIAIGIGTDQKPTLETLDRAGALVFAGWADDPALADHLRALLGAMIADEGRRLALAARAHALIDGGGGERIAAALKTLLA